MAPSRLRSYEPSTPLLPCVTEEEGEENDSENEEEQWSLSSSLLNTSGSSNNETYEYSSSVHYSDNVDNDEDDDNSRRRRRRRQEEMKDLLSLGSSRNSGISSSSSVMVTPETKKQQRQDPPETQQQQHHHHHSNSLRHSTEYSKYFKMLAAGVPIGWVVKVCEVDRKDPSVLYLNPDEPLESQIIMESIPVLGDSDAMTPIKSNATSLEERNGSRHVENAQESESVLLVDEVHDDAQEEDFEPNKADTPAIRNVPFCSAPSSPGGGRPFSSVATEPAVDLFGSRLGICNDEEERQEDQDKLKNEKVEEMNGHVEEGQQDEGAPVRHDGKEKEIETVTDSLSSPKELDSSQQQQRGCSAENETVANEEEETFHDAKACSAPSLDEDDDMFHDASDEEEPSSPLLVSDTDPKKNELPASKVDKTKDAALLVDFKQDKKDVSFRNHVPQNVIFRDFSGPAKLEQPVTATKTEEKQAEDSDDNGSNKGGFFGFFGRNKSKPKPPPQVETLPVKEKKALEDQRPAVVTPEPISKVEEKETPLQLSEEEQTLVPSPKENETLLPTPEEYEKEAVAEAQESSDTIQEPLQTPEDEDIGEADAEAQEDSSGTIDDEPLKTPVDDDIVEADAEAQEDSSDSVDEPHAPLHQDEPVSSVEYQEQALPLIKEPVYAKYFLMLKAGVPTDRVRLIFELDGKDPAILDLDPDLPYAAQVESGAKRTNNVINKREGIGERCVQPVVPIQKEPQEDRGETSHHRSNVQHLVPPLQRSVSSKKDVDPPKATNVRRNSSFDLPLCKDPAYARYFLMLKARVPIDRVRNVVELDGKDPGVLDLDPNRSYASQVGSDSERSPSKTIVQDEVEEKKEDGQKARINDRANSVSIPTRLQSYRTTATSAGDATNSTRSAMPKQQRDGGQVGIDENRGPLHHLSDENVRRSLHLLASQLPTAQSAAAADNKGTPRLTDAEIANFDALFARRVAALAQAPSATMSTEEDKASSTVEKGDELVLKDDPEYAKYFKMLKLGLPLGAAKQAMMKDGKDCTILDLDHNKPLASQRKVSSDSSSGDPPLKDDPEYAKYFKMLKLGLPLGAVKQAMTKDGKDCTILDLDHNKPLASQRNASLGSSESPPPPFKDDPAYAKYFEMLKLGLPLGAVKQAMVKDGKDCTILDLDHNKPLASQRNATSESSDSPPLKDDPEYSKYFKMIKMKLPVGAVKQAMVKDGKDVSVLDLDPEKPLAGQRKGASGKADSQQTKKDSDGPALKDDPEYSKYFKMLKMKLPIGAVRQAMVKDGKDVAILELDPEKSLAIQRNGSSSAKEPHGEEPKEKSAKVVRKRLFWNSIDKSNLQGSLWAKAHSEKALDLKGLEYDEDEFASLFTLTGKDKTVKNKLSDASAKQPKSKQQQVQLIDSRRQMNGSILLAKYKHDYKVLAQKVDHLDSGSMEETELRALMQLLPTKDESLAIRSYLPPPDSPQTAIDDAISKLGECEKFMLSMLDVKNAEGKFECMLYKAQFNGLVNDLASEISMLNEALVCVRNSDKLARLMVFALRLGNTLNTGASGEEVAAITLDSLLKLHEAKAFDKKTSVLHYLVSIIQKNDEEVLSVSEELLPALKAERIVADALTKSLGDLKKGLERLKTMVKEIRSEMSEGESLSAMETFVKEAEEELKRLATELDSSKVAFSDLLKYFGEKKDMRVHEFFSTLTRFIATFESARADVRRMQETKARRERMAKSQKSKTTAKISTGTSIANPRSAVLHDIVRLHTEKKLKETELYEEKKLES